MWMKFRKFWIESWESYLNYFQNYILRKSSLLKRLKDLASEHHSVNNALTVSKHCWNQQGTTIILFFPWIWEILNWKKFLLVWFVILRLFVNSLTADNKYSRCNLHIFYTNSNAIISKTKNILSIFYCSSEMCIKI